jgi:hypothetical protein
LKVQLNSFYNFCLLALSLARKILTQPIPLCVEHLAVSARKLYGIRFLDLWWRPGTQRVSQPLPGYFRRPATPLGCRQTKGKAMQWCQFLRLIVNGEALRDNVERTDLEI